MTVINDPQVFSTISHALRHSPLVVLYIGPDQIMPLTSVLGAIAGIALMFWNRVVGLFGKVRAMFSRSTGAAGKSSAE